jgi:hypothetical protein
MAYRTIDRDDERDVVYDGGGETGWRELLAALPRLVDANRPLVLDVSARTLLPAQVADLRQVIAELTGRDVRIACSRLSGRRLLRRLLPDEVAVVLAQGVMADVHPDMPVAPAGAVAS